MTTACAAPIWGCEPRTNPADGAAPRYPNRPDDADGGFRCRFFWNFRTSHPEREPALVVPLTARRGNLGGVLQSPYPAGALCVRTSRVPADRKAQNRSRRGRDAMLDMHQG
jgi:hypothetical protein